MKVFVIIIFIYPLFILLAYMENKEQSLNLEYQNGSLKKMIQQQTQQLYKLIEYSLNQSYPQIQQFNNEPKLFIMQNGQSPVQSLIKQQMSKLALQNCQFDNQLKQLSKGLLQRQLAEERSAEMQLILSKYEENICPIRSQVVDKQNQLYYVMKNLYQAYEDDYFNCIPTPDRLKAVDNISSAKQHIVEQCRIFLRELEEIQLFQNQNQNKQNIQTINQQEQQEMCKQNNSQSVAKKGIQEHYEPIQDKIKRQVQQKYSQINIFGPKAMKSSNQTIQNSKDGKNSGKTNFFSNKSEQNTTVSLKANSSYITESLRNQQNIPNFSKMSRRDYELFHIYFHKIDRQQQKYNKIVEQYENYRQVYKLLSSQNKHLIQEIKKRKHLKNVYPIQQDQNFLQQQNQIFQQASKIEGQNYSEHKNLQEEDDFLMDTSQAIDRQSQLNDEFVIKNSNFVKSKKINDYIQSIAQQLINSQMLNQKNFGEVDEKSRQKQGKCRVNRKSLLQGDQQILEGLEEKAF